MTLLFWSTAFSKSPRVGAIALCASGLAIVAPSWVTGTGAMRRAYPRQSHPSLPNSCPTSCPIAQPFANLLPNRITGRIELQLYGLASRTSDIAAE
ncbi:MAG: hypothetical protein F6J93_06500 [Oscillatoria sp. SIO1A7]|nr:hypothetical protein [Oscillatoria sp. SIO1A7]